MEFPSFTATKHTTSYPAISPTLSAVSQKGRNVLVTGAGSGIGRATALSFARAGATNVALLGRNSVNLEESRKLIESLQSGTKAHVHIADMRDESALNSAFDQFTSTVDGPIHVVAAVAGFSPELGMAAKVSASAFLQGFQDNTMGTINTVQAYVKHLPAEPDPSGFKGHVIHTSAGLAHCCLPMTSTYALAKAASTKYLEFIALENPDLQVISYHPGTVDTAMYRLIVAAGMQIPATEDVSLAADFTVWASSPESAFLGSGRLIWANWDVDELKEKFDKIRKGQEADGKLFMDSIPLNQQLTIGLIGWC